MKFLIDADCPRCIAPILRKGGHPVLDIRDIEYDAPDHKIYEFIKQKSLILITRDTDFGNILRYPVGPNFGIILLRVHLLPVNEIADLAADAIARIPEKQLFGSLIVISQNRYRIHRF